MTELKTFHIVAKAKQTLDHVIITVSNVLDERAAKARIDLASYDIVSTHPTHAAATTALAEIQPEAAPAVEMPVVETPAITYLTNPPKSGTIALRIGGGHD